MAEDDLTAMGRAESVGHLDQKLERSHTILVQHIDAHKQRGRIYAGVATLVGALLTLAASLFRDATTAGAERKCESAARMVVMDARAEHGELRAADQRLADKQHELDREFQKLAMWRLDEARGVKPR